jgi:hypothetical protein
MNSALIILECFISPGEYVFINDCFHYFHENDFVNIIFVENTLMTITTKDGCRTVFGDTTLDNACFIINNILPNLKKLSPDELMIRDIIT